MQKLERTTELCFQGRTQRTGEHKTIRSVYDKMSKKWGRQVDRWVPVNMETTESLI